MTAEAQRNLVITYDYFRPSVRAGGPVVSLENLADLLSSDYRIVILTGNRDSDGQDLGVPQDVSVCRGATCVRYLSGLSAWVGAIRKARDQKNVVFYLNGFMSVCSLLLPLVLLRDAALVVSPRGMLSSEAMNRKALKKRIFVRVVRTLLYGRGIFWHATSDLERDSIIQRFGASQQHRIKVIGNVPRTQGLSYQATVSGKTLRVITVALIGPMKNIHSIIGALSGVHGDIEYLIYGPVHDEAYKAKCVELASKLPPNVKVKFCGPIQRENLHEAYRDADLYAQPSESENFGHSIFEALYSGVPVLTSFATPWVGLSEQGAGTNVDPRDVSTIAQFIQAMLEMNDQERQAQREAARHVALSYLQALDFRAEYGELFSSAEVASAAVAL